MLVIEWVAAALSQSLLNLYLDCLIPTVELAQFISNSVERLTPNYELFASALGLLLLTCRSVSAFRQIFSGY